MKAFYEFASNSPFLTFFLVLVIMSGLEGIARGIGPKSKCKCPEEKVKP